MPTIHYILADGSTRDVDAKPGASVMETAIRNNVRGIEAECGGSCSCATCHVYVGDGHPELVGPRDPFEDEMLTGTAAEREADSRLSCQIRLEAGLDGLVVRVPDRQY